MTLDEGSRRRCRCGSKTVEVKNKEKTTVLTSRNHGVLILLPGAASSTGTRLLFLLHPNETSKQKETISIIILLRFPTDPRLDHKDGMALSIPPSFVIVPPLLVAVSQQQLLPPPGHE